MSVIKVGILGLGTVGGGTTTVLQRNADEIVRRTGRPIEVSIASVRNLSTDRDCDCSSIELTDDPYNVINSPDVAIVVELIGGDTLSKELVLAAIARGKHVVTANKALRAFAKALQEIALS
jgi:homoserine dehydrogenase